MLFAGGTLGTAWLLSQVDESATENAAAFAERTPQRMRKIFHEVGNVKVMRPIAVVVFLGSLTSGNEYLQDAAFTSVQAIVFANLVTNGLKLAVGRARPSAHLGAQSIVPFSGRRSFPSGHATTVFALTTPWLLYYPRVEMYVLFALGAGTAFVRMIDDYHWLSDVVIGGAIGAGTGYLLTRRHLRTDLRLSVSPIVMGGSAGLRAVLRL